MLIIATKIKAVMISILYRRARFTDRASDHPEIQVNDSRLYGKPEGAMKYNRPGQAPVGGVGSRRRVCDSAQTADLVARTSRNDGL
jgi:hypothetical protein